MWNNSIYRISFYPPYLQATKPSENNATNKNKISFFIINFSFFFNIPKLTTNKYGRFNRRLFFPFFT